MANAYDPGLVKDIVDLLNNCEQLHRHYMFDAIKNSSESEALREVKTTQYNGLLRDVQKAVIALSRHQMSVVESEKALDARRTEEVNDLIDPKNN